MKLTYLSLSAHPARSTPRPDLCLRPERSAFALARSIWSHPITLKSLTRGGMDSRVRRFLLGLTNFSLRMASRAGPAAAGPHNLIPRRCGPAHREGRAFHRLLRQADDPRGRS